MMSIWLGMFVWGICIWCTFVVYVLGICVECAVVMYVLFVKCGECMVSVVCGVCV